MAIQSKAPKTRTIGFRLTEAEYTQLVTLAEQKQRRTAELVRIIVVSALKRYTSEQPQVGAAAPVESGQ